MRRVVLAVWVIAVGTAVAEGQGPPPPGSPSRSFSSSSSSASQPVSPVAVAAWTASRHNGGDYLLDLLVVWRGSPGWFARGNESTRSGGSSGPGGSFYSTMTYSDLQLEVVMAVDPRTVTLQGKAVPIASSDINVILVDGVDSATGPAVVRTLRVDPAMPPMVGWPPIEEVLRRSPEIVDFLQCNTRIPDVKLQQIWQQAMDRRCPRLASQ